jgi:hypothetical protein
MSQSACTTRLNSPHPSFVAPEMQLRIINRERYVADASIRTLEDHSGWTDEPEPQADRVLTPCLGPNLRSADRLITEQRQAVTVSK